MKKLTLALMIAAALTGCASFPDGYDKPLAASDLAAEKRDDWGTVPAVTFVQSNAGLAVRKYNEIPAAVRAKRVALSFKSGAQVTLGDMLFALNAQGMRVVSRLSADTLKEAYPVIAFDGTLGDVLGDMGSNYNVAVEYRDNTVFVVESNRFAASLPQNKDFLEAVAKNLEKMGTTNVRADIMSGKVYYNAKPDVGQDVEEYLNSIAKNAAMVSLQVAVLTVTMNREVNIGFDWAKFAVLRGSGAMTSQLGSIFNNGTGTGTTTGTGTGLTAGTGTGTTMTTPSTTAADGTVTPGTTTTAGGVVANVAKLVTGSLLGYSGSEGFGAKFANNAFSLNAALKALSTYGNARTEQNVIMSTISGLTVKINSGDDIPYTKSVGSATASGGATTGSAQTDIIKSGLELEVTPHFDSSDGTLTSQVKVKMSTLVAFKELSAGLNLGTMSQPQMKNLGFENFGRLNAGETFVVGGITYDQLSNNYTNFPGMEKMALGSKAQKVERNAIYIVVRPTVVIYTPQANELNAKLRALEAQAAAKAGEAR
jgi:type II secretory pathway component GspD/PulD (secretin)